MRHAWQYVPRLTDACILRPPMEVLCLHRCPPEMSGGTLFCFFQGDLSCSNAQGVLAWWGKSYYKFDTAVLPRSGRNNHEGHVLTFCAYPRPSGSRKVWCCIHHNETLPPWMSDAQHPYPYAHLARKQCRSIPRRCTTLPMFEGRRTKV